MDTVDPNNPASGVAVNSAGSESARPPTDAARAERSAVVVDELALLRLGACTLLTEADRKSVV